jgi:protease-4
MEDDQPSSDKPPESGSASDPKWGPPPSGEPTSRLSPPEVTGAEPPSGPAAASSPAIPPPAPNAATYPRGWYNGPWPAEGIKATESTGAAIGRTAIKALTFLIIVFGLPVIGLFFMIFALAGLGAAAGNATVEDDGGIYRDYLAGERSGSVRLVAVPVIGGIMGEDRGGGGFLSAATGVTYGYSVKETLLELAEDDSVDGVLLELDSPGGTVFGSKAIADGVAEYRARTGKPVLAFVSGISASGGMYAMAGADEIVADHGTLIGSIGVIFGPFVNYDGITAVEGAFFTGGVTADSIEYEYLTAGRSKDLGSPYRELTPEERKILEEGLDDAYDGFVDHVAEGRDLSASEITSDLGALIFGEQQARTRGLIDTIANRDEAHQRLAELAGAEGDDWRLDRASSGPAGFFDLLFSSAAEATSGSEVPEANLPSMCTGSAALLAYHGNPADLCAPLINSVLAGD